MILEMTGEEINIKDESEIDSIFLVEISDEDLSEYDSIFIEEILNKNNETIIIEEIELYDCVSNIREKLNEIKSKNENEHFECLSNQ